jgi:hypothetical protein
MPESAEVVTSDLVDLNRFTLASLDSYRDAALAPALAPLLRQIDTPISSVGGHNS